MDMFELPLVLIISLLLPIGFVIGYATRSLVAFARRTPEGFWSVSD
jgi:hypothetical protein